MTINLCVVATNSNVVRVKRYTTAVAPAIPTLEAWLWQNTTALSTVIRGVQQAGRGEIVDLGSFAQYADIEVDD
jgi:hypothetical protein